MITTECNVDLQDYALLYKINAPFRSKLPEQPHAEVLSLWLNMLLLGLGCDVNEVVHSHLHGTCNRIVWNSYLYYIHDHNMNDHLHHKTAWLLITNGAAQTEDRVMSSRDHRGGRLDTVHDNVYEVGPPGWVEYLPMGGMLKGLRYFKHKRRMALRDMYVSNTKLPVAVPTQSMKAMLAELFGEDEANAMQQYISRNGRERGWAASFLMLGAWRSTAGEATQFVWDSDRIPIEMEAQRG